MKKYKYKQNKTLRTMSNVAIGNTKLGVITGVGSSVSTSLGAGMGSSFSTIASFAPVTTTAVIGKSLIRDLNFKKKKK